MPEYRQNPLTGQWVILAPDRAKRPNEFKPSAEVSRPPRPEYLRSCDFCPGHERRTPPEVHAVRDDYASVDCPGWRVRVFANKFPAAAIDAEGVPTPESIAFKTPTAVDAERATDLRVREPAVGIHEVLVESPAHDKDLWQLPAEQVELVVSALRHRTRMIMQARAVKHVCVFKNCGPAAGATIEHGHFQILATSVIPPSAKTMVERQESFDRERGRPLMAALLEEELESGRRIVATNDEFAALCPWASQASYETWIVPRDASAFFSELPDRHVGLFAALLRDVLGRIHRRLDGPDYNVVIHGGPKWVKAEAHHRWFVRITPRGATRTAGYELGTGVYINPTLPEDAAAALREAAH